MYSQPAKTANLVSLICLAEVRGVNEELLLIAYSAQQRRPHAKRPVHNDRDTRHDCAEDVQRTEYRECSHLIRRSPELRLHPLNTQVRRGFNEYSSSWRLFC